jgi:hypothetical protein
MMMVDQLIVYFIDFFEFFCCNAGVGKICLLT